MVEVCRGDSEHIFHFWPGLNFFLTFSVCVKKNGAGEGGGLNHLWIFEHALSSRNLWWGDHWFFVAGVVFVRYFSSDSDQKSFGVNSLNNSNMSQQIRSVLFI